MISLRPLLTLAAATIGACASSATSRPVAASATAAMRDVSGRALGTVRLTDDGRGTVRIQGELDGLPAGAHGIHFHAVARCDAPSFESAGPHANPGMQKHGLENPEGPHAGDLPSVQAGTDGRLVLGLSSTRVSLVAGSASLMDADGSALVIHAAGDDQRTDPSGNSGARIACGVVVRS